MRRYARRVDDTAKAPLHVIHRVVDVLSAVHVPVWLFAGWGLDARIGRITRSHGDIEFWVERSDRGRSEAALVEAGSKALSTQPPEEACEFIWDGVDFSTAYFNCRAGGMFYQPQGRWSDWMFPPDSFGDEPGRLEGMPVPAMSVAGMLAMKEQFPTLRNGRPWRDKDIGDMAILRELLSGRTAQHQGTVGPDAATVVHCSLPVPEAARPAAQRGHAPAAGRSPALTIPRSA
jgi:hypothetical protein